MSDFRVDGLVKRFRELTATDDVTLQLKEGRLSAIIGPNGAGKTTFINLLSGALLPDRGTITFLGRDITSLSPDARVQLGLTRSFQIINLFALLSVEQNILLPVLSRQGKIARMWAPVESDREAHTETEEILADIGLSDKCDLEAKSLSHGDQRLLELGIAIASRPRYCFLDEPTSGMNPVERTAVLDLVRKLSNERYTTFIIIEHDMDVVFSMAESIYVLHRGRLLAEGTPSEIRNNRDVKEVYLGEELEA